jgi:hypothetical protein
MTSAGSRLGAVAAMAMVLVGCGSNRAADRGVASPPSTAAATTASTGTPSTRAAGATSTTARPATTAATSPTPTSAVAKPPPVALGPEWTQRDGRVLIEATASGDPQALLRDLQALGLTEGVVFGRLVNGWLPVGAFDTAQRLATLQFVRPTGAGTG